MSNRKKIRPADRPCGGGMNGWLAAHDGLRVPGGCGYCSAEQQIVAAAGCAGPFDDQDHTTPPTTVIEGIL